MAMDFIELGSDGWDGRRELNGIGRDWWGGPGVYLYDYIVLT
jgi:hypothetical protein